MEAAVAAVDAITAFIKVFLDSLNIRPSSYARLFPTLIDVNDIDKLADEGLFPVLSGLAPSITYCLLLGVARLVLTKFVFKVRRCHDLISFLLPYSYLNCPYKCSRYPFLLAAVINFNQSSIRCAAAR